MGNESSAYQDVSLGDAYEIEGDHTWTLHSATKKSGEGVSVFIYKKDKRYSEYVENAVKVRLMFYKKFISGLLSAALLLEALAGYPSLSYLPSGVFISFQKLIEDY